MTTKDTKHNLMLVKKNILDRYIKKILPRSEVAKLLNMHPNAISRLKDNYLKHGDCVLVGRKTGPKSNFRPYNRTSEQIEDIIAKAGSNHPELGPKPLADHLADTYQITTDPTTVWRILKRKGVRYTTQYKRFKQEPKLYCLDTPGKILQMDACYPFGRSRDLASFDAIDDCSRVVFGKAYDVENDQNAMDFVTELVARTNFPILAIKVDNRYGHDFKTYCEQVLHIQVIYNDPYHPEQNGKIERFHKTLKHEFYYPCISFFDSFDIINYKYRLWQGHYNAKRKHYGYGMDGLTPQQKLNQANLQLMANKIINQTGKVTLTLQ
jgi:IS30 family transposase